jgi:hypothetical protein
VIFDEVVDTELCEICHEIAKRYEIEFLEIGVDKDHINICSFAIFILLFSLLNFCGIF